MTSFKRLLLLVPCLVPLLIPSTSALAAAPAAPSLSIQAVAAPTNISPSTGGVLTLLVTNDGGASTSGEPVTVTDTLPPGLRATEAGGEISPKKGFSGNEFECTIAGSAVSCIYPASLPDDSTVGLNVTIKVTAEPGVTGPLAPANIAAASGGGAAPVSVTNVVTVSSQEPAFGLEGPFSASLFDDTGTVDTQAGDHPESDTTAFAITTFARPEFFPRLLGKTQASPNGNLKDAVVRLPPGFVADPQAAATCPQYLVAPPNSGKGCPPASVVGSVAILTEDSFLFSGPIGATTGPIFNVPPERGRVAQFAFDFSNNEAMLYANLVHSGAGYVAQVSALGIPIEVKIAGVRATFFGDPAVTDGVGLPPAAFFTNPADCTGGPLRTQIYMDSWESPGAMVGSLPGTPDLSDPAWVSGESVSPAPTGCDKLQFSPEIEAQPTTAQTSSPSGLNVDLKIPQNTNPTGLATPDLKNVTVALPRGLSISPSSANGLQACSDAQFAAESTEPSTCPEASVVGSVKVHTPLLEEELEGQVFVGAPQCSPCSNADAQAGRLVRLFIEIANAKRGIDVKLPGTVSLDPSTGQLTASFKEAPQLPFDNLEFKFKSGERAPLSTPSACGGYTGSVDLTPWSAPYTADANLSPGFEINQGCGAQGFAPSFTAGTVSPQAGAYSPFTLSFARSDSEQDFNALEATLPPGLLAKLAGITRCGEAEANAGTCPESTRIGSVTVGAGPGADPYYVTGQIYLTGSYNGGPFGETVEVPAVAGPFNLGTVVVRGSIRINPTTAQAMVVSNPFPSILDGIPLQVKTVNVTLDRPGFTFNPTSCGALAVTGKLVSTEGASAGVSTPFAAANCANLAFKPVLSASTAGRASKANGASFDVKVSYPSGPFGDYANIKSVKVDLPVQLPSRLSTLQKACLAKVFGANPANCPSASDVGTATASTPLLSVPVSGPAYLVSHGGEAFPDLEIVLQGEGVTLVLVGNTQIKKGITSSTFKAIPDAPVSGFELKLPTGKYSILGANVAESAKYSLCGQSLSMPTAITGQNGTPIKQDTKIGVTGCPKVKKAAKKKPSKASKSNRRGK